MVQCRVGSSCAVCEYCDRGAIHDAQDDVSSPFLLASSPRTNYLLTCLLSLPVLAALALHPAPTLQPGAYSTSCTCNASCTCTTPFCLFILLFQQKIAENRVEEMCRAVDNAFLWKHVEALQGINQVSWVSPVPSCTHRSECRLCHGT